MSLQHVFSNISNTFNLTNTTTKGKDQYHIGHVPKDINPCYPEDPPFSFQYSAQAFYIFQTALCTTATVFTILLNIIFLSTMCYKRKLRTLANKLFILLSVTDLLQGLTVWPMGAAAAHNLHMVVQVCWLLDLVSSLGYILGFMSVTAIFLISLEQFTAIHFPFFHEQNMTITRMVVPFTIMHVVLSIANLMTTFKYEGEWIIYKSVVSSLGLLLIILMCCVLYPKIMHTATKTATVISKTNVKEGKQIKGRARAAKTGLIILVTLIFCYLPTIVYNIYEYQYNGTTITKTYVKLSLEMASMLNSVLDPLVYYWRLRSVKAATKEMMYHVCRKIKHIDE